MINGYDTLNITKLDILDEIKEIKIGVKYLIEGKEIEGFPGGFLYFLVLIHGNWADGTAHCIL